MTTTTSNFLWVNQESVKVFNYSRWVRSKQEIVKEFFWLRVETIYDDEWVNVVDMINEFRSLKALEEKRVKYNSRLTEMWITEQEFINMFPEGLPLNKEDEQPKSNTRKSAKAKAE